MTSHKAFALGVVIAALAGEASAHAFLDHAVPPVGATLAAAPAEVAMVFSEPLEAAFSGATIATGDGRSVAASAATLDPQNKARMVLRLPPLTPGKYKVSWHAVSVDTHRTQGEFTFEIRP